MKYYLCQTPNGPQLADTQANAKALDKNYQTVEIDFAKHPMMDHLNDLMRRAHANEGGAATGLTMVDRTGDTPVVRPATRDEADAILSAEIPQAGNAHRKPQQPSRDRAQRTWDQIELEEFIFAIPSKEAYRLDAIQSVIDARREELNQGGKK